MCPVPLWLMGKIEYTLPDTTVQHWKMKEGFFRNFSGTSLRLTNLQRRKTERWLLYFNQISKTAKLLLYFMLVHFIMSILHHICMYVSVLILDY